MYVLVLIILGHPDLFKQYLLLIKVDQSLTKTLNTKTCKLGWYFARERRRRFLLAPKSNLFTTLVNFRQHCINFCQSFTKFDQTLINVHHILSNCMKILLKFEPRTPKIIPLDSGSNFEHLRPASLIRRVSQLSKSLHNCWMF